MKDEPAVGKVVLHILPPVEPNGKPTAMLRYIRKNGSVERLDRQVNPTNRQIAGLRRHGIAKARELQVVFVDYTPQTTKRSPRDGDFHPPLKAHPAVR